MKYEPVFGDQSLFDDAPEDAEMAASVCQMPRWYTMFNGKVLFCDSKKESWQSADFNRPGSQLLAMRRIIAEPKRWTVEDQKAGRLPEVGCRIYVPIMFEEQNVIYSSEKVIVSISDNGGAVTRTEVASINLIKPIETPAEKAQREEDEWVNKAWSETAVFAGVAQDEHDRLRIHLRHIYKAQLSGELQAPKGGE